MAAPGDEPAEGELSAAGAFAHDPSQLVLREECEFGTRPKLSASLAALPQGVFTHIWIVGEFDKALAAPAGYVAVPRAGSGLLFAAKPKS